MILKQNKLSLSGQAIKGIALLAMLLSHIAQTGFLKTIPIPILVQGRIAFFLECIGRLSYPIFAFYIAEGIRHTQNKPAYLIRLGIAALLTEPIYDFAFSPSNRMHDPSIPLVFWEHGISNILFTFFCAALAGCLFQNWTRLKTLERKCLRFPWMLLGVLLCYALTLWNQSEYWQISVPLVLLLLIVKRTGFQLAVLAFFMIVFYWFIRCWDGIMFTWQIRFSIVLAHDGVITSFALLSLLPLACYHGRRGARLSKNLFYIFYPAHLLALGFLREIVFL